MELFNNSLYSDGSLKGYWRLEGNSLDETTGNHDGTDLNATYGTGYGKYGQGIYFSGTGNSLIANHADLRPSTNFSVGAWIKTTSTAAAGSCFFSSHFRDAGGQQAGFGLWVAGTGNVGKFYGIMGAAGTGDGDIGDPTKVPTAFSSSTVNDGVFHLLVMTYDGSALRLYIDGALNGTPTSTSITVGYDASNVIRIGADTYQPNPNNIANAFDGSIDDVFIFNGKVLTVNEITELYTDPSGNFLAFFC